VKLRKGEYAIVEEKVHPEARAVGREIRELDLPRECMLVTILRKGQVILPHGDVRLQPVDEVIAIVHANQASNLAALLGKPTA